MRPPSLSASRSPSAWLLPLLVGVGCVSSLAGCPASCATYVVVITVLDQSTGDLLCDAKVTFGAGDAGAVIDASVAPTDAEVDPSSSVCQWDVVSNGGTYTVTAKAAGFQTGVATVQLQADSCGTATAPVTVILVRS